MVVKPIYIVVTPFFPSPTDWSGSYCLDFVKALARNSDYRVEVFRPGDGQDYVIDGLTVHTFQTCQLPSNVLPLLFRRRNVRSFVNRVGEIAGRDGWGFRDVAICHAHTAALGIYPLAIRRLNPDCRMLLHHHDPQSFGLNLGFLRHCWLYNLIEFPILRRLHEQMDCHVFISEVVKRSFLSAPDTRWTNYAGYKRQMRFLPYRCVRIKDSYVLHNGVDLTMFGPSARKSKCGTLFTIGCIGNFVDWKGQIDLLMALKILQDGGMKIRAIFVGSGVELAKCRKFASERGLDVDFRREVRHGSVVEFYRQIDLFVLPSYFEGFGCVFAEAWASGVPFITCEGQGMDDLIAAEDRHLWLCKPGSADDLAEKIVYYSNNRPKQKLTGPVDIDILIRQFLKKIA